MDRSTIKAIESKLGRSLGLYEMDVVNATWHVANELGNKPLDKAYKHALEVGLLRKDK